MSQDAQPSLREQIAADIKAARRARAGRLAPSLFPNFFAVLGFRFAHRTGRSGFIAGAHAIVCIVSVLTGAEINWRADIGPGFFIEHPVGLVIPEGVVIGRDFTAGAGILLGNTWGESKSNPSVGAPTIGDGVIMSARASAIGPVHIGDGALVGAHALVLHDVPAGAVARGAPARSYIDGVTVPPNSGN